QGSLVRPRFGAQRHYERNAGSAGAFAGDRLRAGRGSRGEGDGKEGNGLAAASGAEPSGANAIGMNDSSSSPNTTSIRQALSAVRGPKSAVRCPSGTAPTRRTSPRVGISNLKTQTPQISRLTPHASGHDLERPRPFPHQPQRHPCPDPQRHQRLQPPRPCDVADVERPRPTERLKQLAGAALRFGVVAADQHRHRLAELRVDHRTVSHGVEALHDLGLRKLSLHALAEAVGRTDVESRRHAFGKIERVRGVEHDLAAEALRAGELQRVLRALAVQRQEHDLARRRRVGERSDFHRRLVGEGRELARVARAHRHAVAVPDEAAGERFGDVAAAEDADIHDDGLGEGSCAPVHHRNVGRLDKLGPARAYLSAVAEGVVMSVNVLERNNVAVSGHGTQPMLFAHGFGCDQHMWRFVAPAFEEDYRVVLFDYVGGGGSDASAYDPKRYSSLEGYAQDVLDVIHALDLRDVIFVGHSVSSMIGILAANREPDRFARLILIGPSPRYINDPPYVGGFERKDIDGLFDMMDRNFIGWANFLAPAIMK